MGALQIDVSVQKKIEYNSRYESLAQVTIDWCKGKLVVEGKSPDRVVYAGGELIAKEPKQKKLDYEELIVEELNEYAVAKGGESW